ncbi:class IIb bacteriocin, lactobin A/cerein 7B family [Enterobacteriaceae bacterium YMB-R22]|jgi:lactobin A/cerein 7B family class IIb bacteriocin|uniref:class IIb bacteriocin, lactobin A/cerein 7B family n=1 Tax=Tenebrionicola larvae TaxID=2815733 RepID=UPI002013BDE9|nr:class IIb bacteriocin, lactobin A/cerein 7B family [Tenebrionicola larvae]MBV4413940.1 class IIb bacteriocin, lactobin A/cerein 7B family [Tenebrionicola larvae]
MKKNKFKMRELTDKELNKVSGGIAPLVVLGGISAGLAVGNAAWNFGCGVYDAIKGKK